MNVKGVLALGFVAAVSLASVIMVANSSIQLPETAAAWLYAFSLTQLLIGLVVYRRLAGKAAMRELYLRETWDAARRKRIAIAAVTWTLTLVVVIGLTERTDALFPGNQSILWQLGYFLILIALPEEVIYRGIAFLAFEKRAVAAVFLSAALFAFVHINNGLEMLPYYFAFGVLLGTLRRFEMTLAELVLWHGLFNFVNDTVWPAVGFRASPTAFYVVAPLALLSITALAGWLATEGTRLQESTPAASN